ncbi:MAG: hypothetical protein IEMM0002_1057 [bacterium]|nr:MAG: hypothetical protein IEMM0002_1057 [bacterium]
MGERHPYKVDVAGSSPVPPTICTLVKPCAACCYFKLQGCGRGAGMSETARVRKGPIRKLNLLIEGTGIRFIVSPNRSFLILQDSRARALFFAFLTSALIIGCIAIWNKDSLMRWDLFPEEKVDLWAEIPNEDEKSSTQPDTDENRRKRITLDNSGIVVSSSNLAIPDAVIGNGPAVPKSGEGAIFKKSSDGETGYLVRFAICLFRKNAELIKKELGAKGVESVIRLERRKIPLYRLKIGPFPDTIAKDKAARTLRETGILTSPQANEDVNDEIMLIAKVRIKNKAAAVKKKMNEISIKTEVSRKRETATVFKVVSQPYDGRALAARRLGELRKKNIDGVLEKDNR